MKALILEGRIVDVAETEFEVHSSLTWMDAPDECTIFWTLENGVLSAPDAEPEKTYFEIRKKEYPAIGDQLDDLMKDMRDGTTTHQTACEAVKAKYPKPE